MDFGVRVEAKGFVVDLLFNLDRASKRGLQKQLKDQISAAIFEGQLAPNASLPSSRNLASKLGVARNTVMLAYTALQEDGFIISKERSGYFVNGDIIADALPRIRPAQSACQSKKSRVNWDKRLTLNLRQQNHIVKPTNWRDYKYCFVYGQIDPGLFPVRHWRECWRDADGVQEITDWTQDLVDRDDRLLLEQIRTRLLTRRGLFVSEAQIIVTVGAQNALFMAAKLLLKIGRTFGFEEPGYPDVRNIASIFTPHVQPLSIDSEGVQISDDLKACDLVYLTPSHQSPTTVTMSELRRQAVLKSAQENDFLILEDDYEAETNFMQRPLPALMSSDENGRVIYIGSLSKTLAPGLRLGYMVGPESFISEVRALRRLIMRHPAANNQRAAAYFLSRGHHESLLRNLVRSNKQKRQILMESMARYLPDFTIATNQGGSSFWVRGPEGLDSRELAKACLQLGAIIEPGTIHYARAVQPQNRFRMGYTSIRLENIEAGVKCIAQCAKALGYG